MTTDITDEHVLILSENLGWSLQHPASCRELHPDLFTCPFHQRVYDTFAGDDSTHVNKQVGRQIAEEIGYGRYTLELMADEVDALRYTKVGDDIRIRGYTTDGSPRDSWQQRNPWHQYLMDFHTTFSAAVSYTPETPDRATKELRTRLIKEEVGELLDALTRDDLIEIADGCADAIYVIVGTCVSYGIDITAVLAEVQRSNMAKVGSHGEVVRDSGGKVLKPDGWTPPDIAGVLGLVNDD